MEYAKKTKNITLGEMEDRLRDVMANILFLSDYNQMTGIETKQNSVTFQWYYNIKSVLEEMENIIAEKADEFKVLLSVSYLGMGDPHSQISKQIIADKIVFLR